MFEHSEGIIKHKHCKVETMVSCCRRDCKVCKECTKSPSNEGLGFRGQAGNSP